MGRLLLTFYDDIDWSISVEQAGAFCYLVKGCPPSRIVNMVRRRGSTSEGAKARLNLPDNLAGGIRWGRSDKEI